MSTGLSIFLIAAGAILYFAVSVSVAGVNLNTVGIILMIVGALGLAVSLLMTGTARRRSDRVTVVDRTTPAAMTVVREDVVVHEDAL
jgi:hypothetical protein